MVVNDEFPQLPGRWSTVLPREERGKSDFFFKDLSLLPEARQVMEHFTLVFGSGNSDLAKIQPLKIGTPQISSQVSPYGILPLR